MKAIQQYFHVVLFIMLYKAVLPFKSVDKTLVYDQLNEATEQYRLVNKFSLLSTLVFLVVKAAVT